MNSIFLSSIINSRATYRAFYWRFWIWNAFSVFSHYVEEMQSSSVTPSGFLWLQTLARMAYAVSQGEIKKNEHYQSVAQSQEKNRALIQLLRYLARR